MLDAVLAISTGLIWATGVILQRKGLSNSNVFSLVVCMTLMGNIILWPLLLIFSPQPPVNLYGFALLSFAGLLHSGLGRLLYTTGMQKLGVPSNSSIFSTNVLFGTLLGVLLLNEQPTIFLWLGIACVMLGTLVIQNSLNDGENKDAKGARAKWLIVPAIASVIVGLSYALRKMGLNAYNEPLVGVALGYLMASILYSLVLVVSPKMRSITPINMHNFRVFWKAGLCDVAGWILMFYALQQGNVAVVVPLLQSQPLFILLLTYLFLKKEDTLSKKLVLGAVIVVVGVVIITSFKG